MTDTYHDTASAAKKLGDISPRTLEKWRLTGDGPEFRKFGKTVRYAETDLERWAEAQRRTSTSDGGRG
jgi:hypothetical protein